MGDKVAEIRYGHIGVDDPLGDEIMVDVRMGRRRGRGKVETLKGGETFNGGWSVLAGREVVLIELEEFCDRGAHLNRRGLKHASKSRGPGEPGGKDTGRSTVPRGGNRGRAWEALESGIKLVAVGSNWGGPRRKGRSERRGSSGGSGELGDRGGAGGDKMAGRWKDGRLGERSRRRKAEGSTGRGKRCEKTGP